MKSTRALIAFAYVADQFGKTNDIAQGLVPLFAPLISARAGSPFDPKQFVADVKKTYDLDMHPYVAEQLAPALAAHGFLEEDRRDGVVVHFKNLNCQIAEPPVREEQLAALVDGFADYSVQRLDKLGLTATTKELQGALFDRLVRPEFLALLLRPDAPAVGPNTLTLSRDSAQTDEELQKAEQHFDYLVASYMLDVHTNKPDQFDLLVAATSGSLVAEVVLDLQHPPKAGDPLGNVRVSVDSPLILDALDLGLEGATPYATQLIEQIKQAGAAPVVFDSTLNEIRRAITRPLENYQRGQDLYGPLGRRLRSNSTFAAYLRAEIPQITKKIEKLGVAILEIDSAERAEARKYFTETNEGELANRLGEYTTEGAREHDARAVADVLRMRGGGESKSIGDAGIVFITRNARLARLSRWFLTSNNLISDDYFPPCITDRYLAGILWIVLGGGGESLSKLRLIANCSAAVVPRQDLVKRMHKFFETLNPDMVKRFEALMTNERAEHFLMDRTLGDATLITQENYEEIYRDIEEVAAERVTKRKDEEIDTIKEKYGKQIEEISEAHRRKFREESARATRLEAVAKAKAAKAQRLAAEKGTLEGKLSESDQRWADACLHKGRRAGLRAWGTYVIVLALATVATALITGDGLLATLVVGALTFILALLGSVVGNRFWPGNPIDKWLDGSREKAAIKYAKEHGVEELLREYTLEWPKNRAVRRSLIEGNSNNRQSTTE